MSQRILVGIDTNLSSATQLMLHAAGKLFTSSQQFTLLHIIPMPQVMTAHPGFYMGQAAAFTPTTWQYQEGEELLRRARLILYQYGADSGCVQTMVRAGVPTEELIKAAIETRANLVVVGSRGNTFAQRLRRLIFGSISRTVLRDAPCPVLIVSLPHQQRPTDLVAWYKNEIRRYLKEHPDSLTVFTPAEAASTFLPSHKRTSGRKEIAAAALALEHLANDGMLCRRDIKGELYYIND